jgi:hypothetical protein
MNGTFCKENENDIWTVPPLPPDYAMKETWQHTIDLQIGKSGNVQMERVLMT